MDFFGKIIVNDNVYIGTGSYILPGVTIESNVIIAAGSVITKSVPSGTIVGGNPARIISSIESYKDKGLKYNMDTKNLDPKQKEKIIKSATKDSFISKSYLKY